MSDIKLPCEIVEDILPSYVDGLTSEVTNEAVKSHMETCEACTQKYAAMKAPVPVEHDEDQKTEVDYLKKNRKKNTIRIILGVIGALILAFAHLIYMGFHGSLIQKARYTKLAKEYVAQNYPGTDYKVTRAVYDFKCNTYYCVVQSESSADSTFSVYPENGKGELRDDYQNRVGQLENTKMRLSRELMQETEDAFADLPWRSRLSYLNIAEFDESRLSLDMTLDLNDVPGKVEYIVWIESDREVPTWEELEEKVVEIKAYAEKKGIHIDYYSVSLEYPYTLDENNELWPTNFDAYTTIYNLPAETIEDPELLHEAMMKQKAEVEGELKEMENGNYGNGEGISYEEAIENK